jgi:hypothetical protein
MKQLTRVKWILRTQQFRCKKRFELDIIRDVDVYKRDPEELPGLSPLESDWRWYFFGRDRRYPSTGARLNRETKQGCWKDTGRDRSIVYKSRKVGVKKSLVFSKSRAPAPASPPLPPPLSIEVVHQEESELIGRCRSILSYSNFNGVFCRSLILCYVL